MIKALLQTSLAKNSALVFKLFIGMLIATKYGAEGRGYIAAFLLVPEIIAFIGGLSVKEGLLYFFAKKNIRFSTYTRIFGLVISIQIPVMIAIALLVMGFSKVYIDTLDISIYLLMIVLIVILELSRFVMRGLCTISKFNISIMLEIVIYSALSMLVILTHENLIYIIISQVVASASAIAFCQWTILKNKKSYRECQDAGIKSVYTYGLKVHLFNVLNTLQVKFSALFISFYLTLADLGIFTVAFTFSLLLQMSLQTPISAVVLPKLARLSDGESIVLASIITRWVTFIGGCYLLFMGVFGEYLLGMLFGDEFLLAYIPMLLLILGMLFKTPVATLNCYFKASGRPETLGKIAILTVPIQITLSIVFIPLYGILGAAYVLAVTGIVFSCLAIRKYQSITNEKISDVLIIKHTDLMFLYNMARIKMAKHARTS